MLDVKLLVVPCLIVLLVFVVILKILFKRVVSPEGKAVLITGCDTGFGNRTAHRLNALGFRVYATVLDTESTGAKELKSSAVFADKMIVLEMNVTNDSQVMEVYEKVKRDLQSSDYELWALVNNAGIYAQGLLDWGTLDTYRKLFEVNVFGTARVTRVFLPLIQASKGRIVNVVSSTGRFSIKGAGVYTMTKYSLVAFTDTLRREQANYHVTVCSIEPGKFKTELQSPQSEAKDLDNSWNQSSDEVKEFYGCPQFLWEKKCTMRMHNLATFVNNIDIVVDDIIHAVHNRNPRIIYRPMSLSFAIMMTFLMTAPTKMGDWTLTLMERIVMFNEPRPTFILTNNNNKDEK